MTGTPGAGKTSILRALENLGYAVVEEAATDAIAAQQAQGNLEPWRDPLFIDAIARLQTQRQHGRVRQGAEVQVHDRSVVCTLALAPDAPCRHAQGRRSRRRHRGRATRRPGVPLSVKFGELTLTRISYEIDAA